MADILLTTVDNPYDPFEDFEKWYIWDELNSVGRLSCCRILAASCPTSVSLTAKENDKQIELAIFDIVSNDPTHQYAIATPKKKTANGENGDKNRKNDQ